MGFIHTMLERADDAIDSKEISPTGEEETHNQVFLSEELFARFLKEEGMTADEGTVTINRLVIVKGRHSEVGTDFTIKLAGYTPIGYDSSHYGLR